MGFDWETQGVLADFRECQRVSQNTDLVFHCANGNVSAHQMIFAGISPFFSDLMQRFVIGRELFPLDLNISLPEIRKEHMEMVVEMVYTGQVRITKRDYQPFREICQLLQLCVPIADYDNFFKNQGSNEDGSNSFDARDAQEQVSIPLKSPTNPRVFVCDECYEIFPLKIALKRHKKSQHDKIESEAPNPQQPPTVTDPSTVEPQLTARLTRQRSLNGSKSLVCLQNDERLVECPDCQSLFGPRQVRQHLAVHLKEELRALLTRSKSVSGVFKCPESLCSYETALPCYMSRHLGVTHDFITKFANEAQMKFLHDAQELILKPRISSLKPPCNSSPEKIKKNLNQRRTSQRILENKDDPENENNDIEPEIVSPREDSIESQSQHFNDFGGSSPTMVSPINQPSSLSLNGTLSKSMLNGECALECPDCQSLIHPSQVKYHLISHLPKELNELLKRSESKPDVFQCQFCSYETTFSLSMKRHVGVTHGKMSKFTNAAQKKFIQDGQDIISKQRRKRKLFNLRTRNRIQENEEFPENGENNVEIEANTGLQDATDNESLPKKDEHALECPDCQSLIQPSRVKYHMINHLVKKLNEFLKKSKSKPEVFECQFCSYETTSSFRMKRHVGVTHDKMFKFTNAGQKKFILDGQDIVSKRYGIGIEDNNGLEHATNNETSAKKDRRALECPDCHRLVHPFQVKLHLVRHLRKKLNKHVKKSESVCGLFQCQFCSYESNNIYSVPYHIGVKHKMMMKYSTVAQKKFLDDAQGMLLKPSRLGSRTKKALKKPLQSVKCPDCLKNYPLPLAKGHLVAHLRKQLNEYVTTSETKPEVFKCQLCSYEGPQHSNVRRHLGITHNMIPKLANPAQKKFLQDAGKLDPTFSV